MRLPVKLPMTLLGTKKGKFGRQFGVKLQVRHVKG